jgi:glycosyltransferase involved in cell wall biosynthesis
MEAMACECAVVSTNTCMIPEVIEHGVSGFLGKTQEELRFYCQKLLDNPDLCKEMGKKARQRIQEKFGLYSFVNNWNNMFFKTVKEWQ